MNNDWTEKAYEEELSALERRLRLFLDKGVGSQKKLMSEAEELLGLRNRFPEVFSRYQAIEGLVADMIARRNQEEIFGAMSSAHDRREAPGCMLGWLFRRK